MQQNVTSFDNKKGDAVAVTCSGSKESNGGFEESYTSRELGERNIVHRAVGSLEFEVNLESGHQSIYRASPMGINQALYKAYLLKMTRSHFPFLSCRGRLHSDHRLGSRTKVQYTQYSMQSVQAKNTSGRSNKLSDHGQKRPARCWAPQHRAVHARELTKGCDDYATGNAMPPKPFRTLRIRYTAYLGLTTWGMVECRVFVGFAHSHHKQYL